MEVFLFFLKIVTQIIIELLRFVDNVLSLYKELIAWGHYSLALSAVVAKVSFIMETSVTSFLILLPCLRKLLLLRLRSSLSALDWLSVGVCAVQ